MNIKFIVMATLLFFIVPRAEAQSCTGCDVPLTPGGNGDLNVPSGKTYCLQTGSYNSGQNYHDFNIAAGGILCIGTGASYYVGWSSNIQGTIINHGILNVDGINGTWNVHIINYGTIVFGQISGGIAGSINNYGTITVTSGANAFSADLNNYNGASFIIANNGISGTFSGNVENHGTIKISSIGTFSANLNNYDSSSFIIQTSIQNVSGNIVNKGLFQTKTFASINTAYVDNRDSFVVENSAAIQGAFDNLGYAYFGDMSGDGLNATVNNDGYFKVDGSLNVGASTYFTNNALVLFNASLNFEGPLLTNSKTGQMYVNGGFEVNSSQMEFSNSGLLTIIGTFDYHDAASGANSCRIYASNGITFDAGSFQNEGLLWSGGDVTLNEGVSLKNGQTGFVRGVNFTENSSCNVTGGGKFYFTGTTNNTAGTFTGDSSNATYQIQFYDATQTSSNIFDKGVQPVNTFRPSSMTPLDTTSFDCGGTPALPPAGNPPNVKGDTIILCHVGDTYTFNLISDSLIVPYDSTYYIYWPALKLFDPDSSSNPTNNTLNLTTAQGTFVADTVNQTIVFTPADSFTYGMAKAQFKVADKTNGNPIANTSEKATLVIHLMPVYAPDTLEVNGF